MYGSAAAAAATRAAALLLALCAPLLTGCGRAAAEHAAAAFAAVQAPVQEFSAARQDETGAVPIRRVKPIHGDVTNVLLVGTDSRAAHGTLAGGNADTIILVSFRRADNTVVLVSIMRDTFLPIGGLDGEYNKLKAAYRSGGAGLLINTINAVFSLDIQSYIAVGLDGFAAFVDETLGGLDVELDAQEIAFINARISEYENESALVKNCPPVTDPPGVVHLNGAQTLIFVRNRTTAAGGAGHQASDYDRAARQQEILRLMYEKFVAQEPLSSVPGIIRFAFRHVETNLDADEIYRLAEPLMTRPVTLQTAVVPFAGTWRYGGDGSGILFDREPTVEQLHALLYGQA